MVYKINVIYISKMCKRVKLETPIQNQRWKGKFALIYVEEGIFDALCCKSNNLKRRGEPDTFLLAETEEKFTPCL